MRRFIPAAFLLTLLLTACVQAQTNDQTPPVPGPSITGSPIPAQIPHAAELRFALIGQPKDVNAWALFDEQGASYVNYAVMSDYWPRLYTLTPPGFNFAPRAASGLPSPVIPEGNLFTSTVALRNDLKWTDGSRFTAEDIAFTVNSVLGFELGFDWKAFYSPDYLLRAEAVDPLTVKLFFKQLPNVSVWQYGVLQGPILQQAYWRPRMASASALLPDEALRQSVVNTRTSIAKIQPVVDSLTNQIAYLEYQGKDNRELDNRLKANQGNLDQLNNELAGYLSVYTAKIQAAQQALFALDHANEPTLGVWKPGGQKQNSWENLANPDFPFEKPNFDRVLYQAFDNENEAIKAFQAGRVDVVLAPTGFKASSTQLSANQHVNLNGRARFLAFNPARPELADPALRKAFACMIWSPASDQSAPLSGFVLPGNDTWRDPNSITPCADLTQSNPDLQLDRAVQFLKSAGYSWVVEPTKDTSGQGLIMPNGQAFPSIHFLSQDVDSLQAHEAELIQTEADRLGIPLTVQYVTLQDIRYEVFSAENYDMAILGWRLSLYPGYLCEWFGGQGQFNFNEGNLKSECDALDIETDLQSARNHILNIQAILAEYLPFIPLYAEYDYETYGNIYYPFESILGGFDGLYGAPSFAIPAL